MYQTIINPLDNKSYSLKTKVGKLILKNYIDSITYMDGGYETSPPSKLIENTDDENIDENVREDMKLFLDEDLEYFTDENNFYRKSRHPIGTPILKELISLTVATGMIFIAENSSTIQNSIFDKIGIDPYYTGSDVVDFKALQAYTISDSISDATGTPKVHKKGVFSFGLFLNKYLGIPLPVIAKSIGEVSRNPEAVSMGIKGTAYASAFYFGIVNSLFFVNDLRSVCSKDVLDIGILDSLQIKITSQPFDININLSNKIHKSWHDVMFKKAYLDNTKLINNGSLRKIVLKVNTKGKAINLVNGCNARLCMPDYKNKITSIANHCPFSGNTIRAIGEIKMGDKLQKVIYVWYGSTIPYYILGFTFELVNDSEHSRDKKKWDKLRNKNIVTKNYLNKEGKLFKKKIESETGKIIENMLNDKISDIKQSWIVLPKNKP